MFSRYPIYKQHDAKDCGPACLRMISSFYGKHFSQEFLRERCFSGRTGTTLLCLKDCANSIGFDTLGVRISWEKLTVSKGDFPCIALWNKNHFVVIYEIAKDSIIVGDPEGGLLHYKHDAFQKQWMFEKPNSDGELVGVILYCSPNEKFSDICETAPCKKITIPFLLKYLKPQKEIILKIFLGLLIVSSVNLIFPFLMQSVVDVGISDNSINFIIVVLIAQLVLVIGLAINNLVINWLMVHTTTRVSLSLLDEFLGKLMRLPISFFDKRLTGDLLQRIGDFTRVESFLTKTIINIIMSLLIICIYGFILVKYNIGFLIIFTLGSLLYVIWILFFLKKRKKLDYMLFQESSNSQSSIIQLINGMQEIKLNNSEDFKKEEWESIQIKLFNINIKNLNWSQTQETGSLLIDQIKNLLISFLAAKSVIDGDMTLGAMISVQFIIGQLNGPVVNMVSFIKSIQDTKISIERMNDIYCKKDEEEESEGKSLDLQPYSVISIKKLSFHYNGIYSPRVLTNIDLNMKSRNITAIVGASGSGKTTLLKLILGFYIPTSGNIYLGNQKISDYDKKIIRSNFGVVMQEGFIFSDTIAKNIAAINDFPDMDKVKYASKMACLDEFINSLPLGYETVIGSEGNTISTGQKQRILIARAVYKNPPFLILDEATNSLDANNERSIMNNLNQFYKNKTVIIVAHRLSTVKNADNIIVLDKGMIVEQGNHDKLISLKGSYYNLVKNQLELGD